MDESDHPSVSPWVGEGDEIASFHKMSQILRFFRQSEGGSTLLCPALVPSSFCVVAVPSAFKLLAFGES